MKTLVIYYSMSGNTKYVAELIKEKMKADLLEINPVKAYPDKRFKKFFWGGKSSFMKESPELEEYKCNLDKYDLVVLGAPLWAGNFAPPLRSFIKENKDKLKDKKIAIYISSSGGNTSKAFTRIKEMLDDKPFISELSIIDPKDKTSKEKVNNIENFIKNISILK